MNLMRPYIRNWSSLENSDNPSNESLCDYSQIENKRLQEALIAGEREWMQNAPDTYGEGALSVWEEDILPRLLSKSLKEEDLEDLRFYCPKLLKDFPSGFWALHKRFLWKNVEIEVSWEPVWLSGIIGHLVVCTKNREPLPITETWYRSHFVHEEDVQALGWPLEYVKAWLDEKDDGKPVQYELF